MERFCVKRWKNYFNGLLNNEISKEELPPQLPVQGPVPKINEDEVNIQLGKMETTKSRGHTNYQ